ncbi:hypothetical protein CHUAL_005363 [Chamberlinius hualienensis]
MQLWKCFGHHDDEKVVQDQRRNINMRLSVSLTINKSVQTMIEAKKNLLMTVLYFTARVSTELQNTNKGNGIEKGRVLKPGIGKGSNKCISQFNFYFEVV